MEAEIPDLYTENGVLGGSGDLSPTNIQTNISYSEKSSILAIEKSSGLIEITNVTNPTLSLRENSSCYSDHSITDAPMVVHGSVETNNESQI